MILYYPLYLGPLTYKENGISYVVGVVSYGAPNSCANTGWYHGLPGVYARVTTVLDWIDEQLNDSC